MPKNVWMCIHCNEFYSESKEEVASHEFTCEKNLTYIQSQLEVDNNEDENIDPIDIQHSWYTKI